MRKVKKYKYIGRNGTIITHILIDNASKIDMYQLTADEGKILTDGDNFTSTVCIYADELDNWVEVDYLGQE